MKRVEELEQVYEDAKAQSDRTAEICGEAQTLFVAAENRLREHKLKEARAFNELTACMRMEQRAEEG